MPGSRRPAGIVANLAGAADIGAVGIDGAGGVTADLALKRRASVSHASHAGQTWIDEFQGYTIEGFIGFEREPRPVRRRGAARPARLAWRSSGRSGDAGR